LWRQRHSCASWDLGTQRLQKHFLGCKDPDDLQSLGSSYFGYLDRSEQLLFVKEVAKQVTSGGRAGTRGIRPRHLAVYTAAFPAFLPVPNCQLFAKEGLARRGETSVQKKATRKIYESSLRGKNRLWGRLAAALILTLCLTACSSRPLISSIK
jgi:hypothetical protein